MRPLRPCCVVVFVIVGCAKKEEAPPAAVPLAGDPAGPTVHLKAADLQGSPVARLNFADVWAGGSGGKKDLAMALKEFQGRLAFTNNDGPCQAAGAAAGGVPHLLAVSAAQPVAAERVRAAGQAFVYAESHTGSLTDSTASNWDGTLGRVTRRQLVSLGGQPDVVHRLAGFVGRVKAEIAKAGGTVTGESPGPDGSGHVLRYEVEGRAGEIEMAVTLLDRPDGELARLLRLGGKRDDLGLFRAVAKAEKGPVLVVVVDEKRK